MELQVGDAMTRGVIYVRPDDNVQRAAEIMKEHDIDSVIIMEGDVGVGIVTDTDIISKIVADGKNPRMTAVAEIMTSPLVTINPDADIDDAARKMRDVGIRRLVVVHNNNIVGMLCEFDLIRVEPALHLLIREHSQWNIADLPSPTGTITGVCEVCGNYYEDLSNVSGRLTCDNCAYKE